MDPRISKQRIALVLDQPFFGALALRLKVVEDPSCETFWVDGVSLGYNPAHVATLNDLELRGGLAQKVLQVANGHCWRMGNRDQERWDDASAEAVNPIVKDAGMLLPAGALLTPRFRGKSAEEIYANLAQKAKQKEQGGKGGAKPDNTGRPQPTNGANTPSASPAREAAPSSGEVRQYRGDDVTVKEAEWKVAVLQAAKAAQMRGALPGGLQAMVTQAVEPVVDWRAILHRFAQQSAPTDYSFAMPNRRYLHMGLYLPSLNEPAVGDAVFVRDTSGTVFDETQEQFAAEILAVNDSVRPRRLIVMDCDTRVTQVQTFERGEPVELLPAKGGGGTVFVDPFRRLAEEAVNPAFLVYLTDMDGRFPEEAPAYPVLWASTTPLRRARQAPFGETIEVIC